MIVIMKKLCTNILKHNNDEKSAFTHYELYNIWIWETFEKICSKSDLFVNLSKSVMIMRKVLLLIMNTKIYQKILFSMSWIYRE